MFFSRFFPILTLTALLIGCTATKKEVPGLIYKPAMDTVFAASVASFHTVNGHWPTDTKAMDLSQEVSGDFGSPKINVLSNLAIIIEFDQGTNAHRRMELLAPIYGDPEYTATYKEVKGSQFSSFGSVSIKPEAFSQ